MVYERRTENPLAVISRAKDLRLTRQERLEVRRCIAAGESFEEVADAVRCTTKTVQRLINAVGGLQLRDGNRSKLRLSLVEREEIPPRYQGGYSLRQIAGRLDRAPSTIVREVHHNGGRARYQAVHADDAVGRQARRPKEAKLTRCPRLRAEIESMLDKRWSPQQISARLLVEFPSIGGRRPFR